MVLITMHILYESTYYFQQITVFPRCYARKGFAITVLANICVFTYVVVGVQVGAAHKFIFKNIVVEKCRTLLGQRHDKRQTLD